MKLIKYILLLFITVFIACEQENDLNLSNIKKRNFFLVVGDTSNCIYQDFLPDITLNSGIDSIDIDFDNHYDIEFEIFDTIIDDCEEFFENCPPDIICDCWPEFYMDYIINPIEMTEIALNEDSTIREFSLNDTISYNNIWSKFSKYPLYRRTPDDDDWRGSYDLFIGLRIIADSDTLYSWIDIELVNAAFIIKKLAIQK